jgi:hypothetical protein
MHVPMACTQYFLFKDQLDADTVKRALARTLDELPMFAAKAESDKKHGVRVSQELGGVWFAVSKVKCSSAARNLSEFLSTGSLVERIAFGAQAAYPKGKAPDFKVSLTTLHLSYFSTGECVVGFNACHGICDAYTMTLFLKTLDYFCRTSISQGIQLEPYSRGTFSYPLTSAPETFRNNVGLIYPSLWFPNLRFLFAIAKSMVLCEGVKLRVNSKMLNQMKEEINHGISRGEYVTSNDLVVAIVFYALQPSTTRLQTVINLRGRSRYIPSNQYVGSGVQLLSTKMEPLVAPDRTLAQRSLDYHHQLHQGIIQDNASEIADYYDCLASMGKTPHYALPYLDETCYTVNSWKQFQEDMFSFTFGGASTPILIPMAHPIRYYLHIQPEYANGDLSLNLMLTAKEKARLLDGLQCNDWDKFISVVS